MDDAVHDDTRLRAFELVEHLAISERNADVLVSALSRIDRAHRSVHGETLLLCAMAQRGDASAAAELNALAARDSMEAFPKYADAIAKLVRGELDSRGAAAVLAALDSLVGEDGESGSRYSNELRLVLVHAAAGTLPGAWECLDPAVR